VFFTYAGALNADALRSLFFHTPTVEQEKFLRSVTAEFVEDVVKRFLHQSEKFYASATPQLRREFKELLRQHLMPAFLELREFTRTTVLERRNRKPSPDTVAKQAEIYRLRQEGWSWGRLAKRFDMTASGARLGAAAHESRLNQLGSQR